MCGAKCDTRVTKLMWLCATIVLPMCGQTAIVPTTTPATVAATNRSTLAESSVNNINNNATKISNYIAYVPNSKDAVELLLLRSQMPNGTVKLLLPIKFLRRIDQPSTTTPGKWHIKIYGGGVEHRLPPFLERILQRVQTYFSVYKHTDTSRPIQRPVVVESSTNSVGNVQLSTADAIATTTTKMTTPRPSVTAAASTITTAGTTYTYATLEHNVDSDVFSSTVAATAPPILLAVTGSTQSAHDVAEIDEYTEFIAIGEDDENDFITVGEE